MTQATIPLFKVHMPGNLDRVIDTLRSGYVTQGPRVEEFEKALRRVLGNERVLTLNSGTSALTLAYRLAGIGPGSTVITTAMTCSATNLPILTAGARPLFADVEPRTGLIDLEDVERIILSREPVDAIVGVDWGGMPCDQDGLVLLGRRYGVPVIADAAHSLGARVSGRPVGSIADMTCFSLQAIKHITTVDGGVLTFKGDQARYARGKVLRWYGIDREVSVPGDSRIDVDIEQAGYKFHMNDVAATLGLLQLPYLPDIVARHRWNAGVIAGGLDSYFDVSAEPAEVESAWWVLTVLLPNNVERDAFREYMLARGVQVSQVHRRNDEYSVFRRYGGHLPGLDEFSSRMTCLPCHWALSEEDVGHIVAVANDWARRHR